jgi:hypothetical protein
MNLKGFDVLSGRNLLLNNEQLRDFWESHGAYPKVNKKLLVTCWSIQLFIQYGL